MANRPRAPGRNQALRERVRGNRQQVILGGVVAIAAVLVAGTLGALAWTARTASAPPRSDPLDEASPGRPSLVLPLDFAAVDFDGTVTPVAADEGPAATSFCNNVPTTDGLTEWSGQVFTEDGDRRRIVQLVARFRSPADAAAYLASNSEIVDCETWSTEAADGPVTFTVVDDGLVEVYGDESRRFDLTADVDGPDLFLRILIARSGRDVLQITYVSADHRDLDETGQLVAEAIERGAG